MKLSCTRDNLHQGLSITSHLTTKNVNLPILQNVLVKAEGGVIRFTTTNLEIAISCSVRGKVEEAGEYTIPSKLFFDYVSLLPNETVTLEKDGEAVHIKSGSYKTKINGLASSEFPLVPSVQANRSYQIPVNEFKTALSQVLFSVATNESRPELTGIYTKFSPAEGESVLTLASTDSYRLSEKVIPLVSPIEQEDVIILPSRTLAEINRILSVFKDDVESPSVVTLELSDNQAVFKYGSVELISRVIEGNYPDYQQIIPTQFNTEAILDRDDFIKSVKTASLFSRTGLFDVTLEFDPEERQLAVKAVDATRGENTTNCSAEVSGKNNNVTVNFRYLLDGLNAMKCEKVKFGMIDASNPCLVVPHESKDKHRYVVMPIRQ
jgi:DNA polymerase III subunit beta